MELIGRTSGGRLEDDDRDLFASTERRRSRQTNVSGAIQGATRVRVLIVEDEPLLAQRLERLCREILGQRLESVRIVTVFSDARARLTESPIDLLLLDLNLHGRDGMELLASSVAGSFHTIVVSANTDQALRAFEYGVMDFIAKPFTRERLEQALQRVVDREARAASAAKFLAARKHGKVELV